MKTDKDLILKFRDTQNFKTIELYLPTLWDLCTTLYKYYEVEDSDVIKADVRYLPTMFQINSKCKLLEVKEEYKEIYEKHKNSYNILVYEIVKAAMAPTTPAIPEIEAETGAAAAPKITANEAVALNLIIEEIGECGNISIVKLMQKADVSRPVFTNVLKKLESAKILTQKNQGAKGIHIVFTDLDKAKKLITERK